MCRTSCSDKIAALGAEYLVVDLASEEAAAEGIPQLVKKAYHMLDLISFFTTGEDETRAWTIERGTKAPQASGVIHTDFENKFIRLEVDRYRQIIGSWRLEQGKAKRMAARGREGIRGGRRRRDRGAARVRVRGSGE